MAYQLIRFNHVEIIFVINISIPFEPIYKHYNQLVISNYLPLDYQNTIKVKCLDCLKLRDIDENIQTKERSS